MKKEERKISAGKHTFHLNKDNILYITIVGEIDGKKTSIPIEAIMKLLNMVNGKVNVFVNLDKAGKPSIKARKLTVEIHKNEKVGKVAHFGVNPVAKVIAAFFMGSCKKKDVRFFSKKERAIEWLKDDRQIQRS
ncbi:MAG: STAS/SEC14 domain-containing protein [bacterium]|nr:STAS/SEC14 domain-containing protein [bacterium]